MLHPRDFFDLSEFAVANLFTKCDFVWSALENIDEHITKLVGNEQTILGEVKTGAYLGNNPIYIAKGAIIEPGAFIDGPAYIGQDVTVRHGAYIRSNVIMLSGSILGHASEAKNSIFLPNAYAPHFNYVGDSILGSRVNLGAGTKLSNLTMLGNKDPDTKKYPSIKIRVNNIEYDTGLGKFGAIIGDDVQTGCNTVLNPGCLVGKGTLIYANLSLRKGYYPSHRIIKLRQETEIVDRI